MKVHFKHPRRILGVLYLPGNHMLPEEIEHDWFFQALKTQGDIKILESVVEVTEQPTTIDLENSLPSEDSLPKKKSKRKS